MNDEPEVVAEYTYDSETPVSHAIIRGIAAVEDIKITEVKSILYNHVDPGALDSLISQENSSDKMEVKFPIEGYWIEISGDGSIRITELS